MSEIAEIIDTLENKIQKLFKKINDLEEKNQALQREIKISVQSNQNQTLAYESLKKEFESLKMANSLLGSEDYKRDTKLKINSLIREIDYCIAQLAD
jgi:cell division septum initiation protein DivIVA